MKDFSLDFGPVIAFILPGLVLLLGVSQHSITVSSWIGLTGSTSSVSGVLLAILCALGLGMITTGLRGVTLGKLLTSPDSINWRALTRNEATHKAMSLVISNCWHYHCDYAAWVDVKVWLAKR